METWDGGVPSSRQADDGAFGTAILKGDAGAGYPARSATCVTRLNACSSVRVTRWLDPRAPKRMLQTFV